jgi:hypothetical protein
MTLRDMGAGLLEGLGESKRLFLAPLVGVWREAKLALADLDAKHVRRASGRT